MKRKLIATVALLLTINFNVYAQEVDTKQSEVNEIQYTTINDIILSRSNTIKINQNIMDKLNINLDSLDEQEDDIERDISSKRTQLNGMKDEVANLQEQLKILKDQEEPNEEAIKALESAIKAMQTNVVMLDAAIKSMVTQLDNIEKMHDNVSMSVEKTKVINEMANNQVILGGQNLIFAYNNIELNEKKIDKNVALMQKQFNMLNIQKKLGLVTETNVEELKLQIENLNYTKKTISDSREKIRRQINIMIGQSFDTPLKVVANLSISDINLTSMDKEKDLKTALGNNYNIKIQEREVEAKKYAVDSSEISQETDMASEDLDTAKLNLEDTKRNEEFKFQCAYEKVKDKEEVLNLANKKLAQEQIKVKTVNYKYKVGLASKKECDDEQIAYDIQVIETETAKMELFNAYTSYQWMIKGLSVQ